MFDVGSAVFLQWTMDITETNIHMILAIRTNSTTTHKIIVNWWLKIMKEDLWLTF